MSQKILRIFIDNLIGLVLKISYLIKKNLSFIFMLLLEHDLFEFYISIALLLQTGFYIFQSIVMNMAITGPICVSQTTTVLEKTREQDLM